MVVLTILLVRFMMEISSAAASRIAEYSSIPSQYKDAVANVYALGIIGGYPDGTFGGNNGGNNFPARKLDSVADIRPRADGKGFCHETWTRYPE